MYINSVIGVIYEHSKQTGYLYKRMRIGNHNPQSPAFLSLKDIYNAIFLLVVLKRGFKLRQLKGLAIF